MDDVNVQDTVNEPVETTTTPLPGEGEMKTTETPVEQPAPQVDVSGKDESELENLKKALKQERDLRRQSQREIAKSKGDRVLEGYDPQDIETVVQHPFVQNLLIKQAETELREGVKDVLSQYPNLPKNVSAAILKNPRGFVNPETTDVHTALIDIQDYLESISEEMGVTTPQPKPFRVATQNPGVGANKQDVELQAILKKPPAEWSDEETALVAKAKKEFDLSK